MDDSSSDNEDDSSVNSNESEDSESSEFGADHDWQGGLDGWNTVHLSSVNFQDDPVEKLLMQTLSEEESHIESLISQLTETSSLSEVVNLFISPLVSVLRDAVNTRVKTKKERVRDADVAEFIRGLAIMSFYRVTHTTLFSNPTAFPPANSLNESAFLKVLAGLNVVNETSTAGDPSTRWTPRSQASELLRKYFVESIENSSSLV